MPYLLILILKNSEIPPGSSDSIKFNTEESSHP